MAAADDSRTYATVYETEDAASASITRETLTIQTAQDRTYVVVANANGSTAGFAATLAPDGEIENQPSEASLVCYNMAMSIVAQYARAPAGPLGIAMEIGGRAIGIPLAVKRQTGASAIVAAGRTSGIAMDVRVDLEQGRLVDASFQEASYAGSPLRIVSRTTCSLGERTPAGTTRMERT